IFITKERGVVSAEFESFDNSPYGDSPRYQEDELKAFVEEAVSSYNKNCGAAEKAYIENKEDYLPVAVESLVVEDKVAKLILDFATADDYLQFNGTADVVPVKDLIIGTVKDGIDSGLDFSGMLNEKGEPADQEKLTSSEKYSLVAVTGNTVMKVEGKIKYVSEGVTIKDENTVVTTEGTNYIIFK
ncbi:MAG: hypothetical protein PUB37_03210, partial [Firmicutes bacterium]|nr:hypothetical protein [Bacillota bacterium]